MGLGTLNPKFKSLPRRARRARRVRRARRARRARGRVEARAGRVGARRAHGGRTEAAEAAEGAEVAEGGGRGRAEGAQGLQTRRAQRSIHVSPLPCPSTECHPPRHAPLPAKGSEPPPLTVSSPRPHVKTPPRSDPIERLKREPKKGRIQENKEHAQNRR